MSATRGKHSIGPFEVDEANKTITLAPGVYTFTIPITFHIGEGIVIDGVSWVPLEMLAPPGTRQHAKETEH